MENHYGIAVANKFSLFFDDECDPLEILKTTEEAKLKKSEKSKKDAKNEAKAAKSKKTTKKPATPVMDQPKGVDVNANKKEGDQRPRGRGKMTEGERTGSARPGGNREFDRPPRRDRQMDRERPERAGDRPPMEFRERGDRPESGRGRGRGERGGRGRGRGGRGGGFGSKREFERHSGSDKTGIKPVDKREGGGAHNWGTMKDDMDDQLNESTTEEVVETPEGNENQNPNAEPTEEEAPAEEEGPKEMTLDEWRAMQTQSRAQTTFNIRKPGEGVNNDQWKKTYILKKKAEAKNQDSEEEESDEEEEEDTRQKKNLLNIEITFNDQPTRGRGGRRGRGGGDRGGRGRGRGDRGGRGGGGGGGSDRGPGDRAPGERGGFGGQRGDRGGNRREAAPHIEDENDFPTLGAK